MKKQRSSNRKAVIRQGAEDYLLVTLVSFAITVAGTRLFLELTGYPQLGGGELHIAHVLWGGLFLFAAALVLLVYANRWAKMLGALFAGIGVGLFIDEVGKFITSTNDYFYPSAAPIVYAVFLLTVLVYLIFRRPPKITPREALYYILQDLEEVLDHDLSTDEREKVLAELKEVRQSNAPPELDRLAKELEDYLAVAQVSNSPDRPPILEHYRRNLRAWERKWLSERRFRAVITGGFMALGVWALYFPVSVLLSIRTPAELQRLLNDLVSDRLVRNPSGLNWFEWRVGLEGAVGLVFLITAALLALGKDRRGIPFALAALMINLTVVNLLVFYFDQFSTIAIATVQFLLLIGVLRFRSLYAKPGPADVTDPAKQQQ